MPSGLSSREEGWDRNVLNSLSFILYKFLVVALSFVVLPCVVSALIYRYKCITK